jgi:hypothetical protein
MSVESFKIGDRVRVRRTGSILGGTCGTIRLKSYMVSSTYFVLFDGWPEVKSMHACHLEHIADEKQPVSTN